MDVKKWRQCAACFWARHNSSGSLILSLQGRSFPDRWSRGMKTLSMRLLAFQWKSPTSLSTRTICDITRDFNVIWCSVHVYRPVRNFSNFDLQLWFVILDKQLYWGLIHTMPEKFEKRSFISTVRSSVHNTSPWKQALFQQKHCSNPGNLKMLTLCFNVDGKHFQNGAFQKW